MQPVPRIPSAAIGATRRGQQSTRRRLVLENGHGAAEHKRGAELQPDVPAQPGPYHYGEPHGPPQLYADDARAHGRADCVAERAPYAAAVLRADDGKAVGPTNAGPLAQADGLAGTDADVRADLRADVVRAERGAVVPADDGEAERGAVRGAELHAHGSPHVLEGALRGAELRPDDGRALVGT